MSSNQSFRFPGGRLEVKFVPDEQEWIPVAGEYVALNENADPPYHYKQEFRDKSYKISGVIDRVSAATNSTQGDWWIRIEGQVNLCVSDGSYHSQYFHRVDPPRPRLLEKGDWVMSETFMDCKSYPRQVVEINPNNARMFKLHGEQFHRGYWTWDDSFRRVIWNEESRKWIDDPEQPQC
jgi:hypothetical protein